MKYLSVIFILIFINSLYNLYIKTDDCYDILKSFEKYNPRRNKSIVRKVIFDNLENSINKLGSEKRTELYWFVYSLSMPSYEKSIAKLDTFEDNFVLKQEYEHSRVHVKLNNSYEKSLDKSSPLYKCIQLYKLIWRIYFSLIMYSPLKYIMIIGEIYLGFNIYDIKGRLNAYKYLEMSDDMRKVLVYHELEEIEHGLDLVPKIANTHICWRILLSVVYSIHYTLYMFIMELQTIVLEILCKKKLEFEKFIPLLEYIKDPLQHIDPKICYSVISNRYPSRNFRNESEFLYKKYALDLFNLDLSQNTLKI